MPSSFVVRLPRITMDNILAEGDDKIILDYLNKTHEITRKKAEELIDKEKTTTANLLNKMLDNKIIKKVGNGPNTKYIL